LNSISKIVQVKPSYPHNTPANYKTKTAITYIAK